MPDPTTPDWQTAGIRIVHGDDLDLNTPQTPGMTRAAAITNASAGAEKLWAGTVTIDPNAKTGAHHHGELESVIYVVSGRARMRWGEQLEFVADAGPGDFIYVPPFVPHQEINANPSEPLSCVLVRSGQEPIVVNLDITPPEEPEEAHWVDPIHPPPAGPVTIFSDGACSGNPGPGGWATRIQYADGAVLELGGFVPDTTNNRMELYAALQGLKHCASTGAITMITDSDYLRKGITQWIHNWKKRGWRTTAKKPVLNQDLWVELDALNSPSVSWEYTRAHAGDPDNERCDEIAHDFSQGRQPELIDTTQSSP